jgi:hypothetical protein
MRQTQKRNDEAARQWLDYQNRQKGIFEGKETAARDAAKVASDENLRMQGQESREAVIDAEAARLEEQYGAGLPAAARDAVASSQEAGQDEVFDSEMAKSLAKATEDARSRIKALAKSSAYGGGTQFGMGQTLDQTYGDAATDIGFLNDRRRGDQNTLLRHQQVQPEVFTYEKPGYVSAMEAASAIIGGMDPASLSSLFGSGKMASSLIPKANPRLMGTVATRAAQPTFSFIPSYAMSAGGGLPGPR